MSKAKPTPKPTLKFLPPTNPQAGPDIETSRAAIFISIRPPLVNQSRANESEGLSERGTAEVLLNLAGGA